MRQFLGSNTGLENTFTFNILSHHKLITLHQETICMPLSCTVVGLLSCLGLLRLLLQTPPLAPPPMPYILIARELCQPGVCRKNPPPAQERDSCNCCAYAPFCAWVSVPALLARSLGACKQSSVWPWGISSWVKPWHFVVFLFVMSLCHIILSLFHSSFILYYFWFM